MVEDLPLFTVAGVSAPLPTKKAKRRPPRKPARDPRAQIATLRQALPHLQGRDRRFALSLLGYWDKRGQLSKAQWHWVKKLPSRAQPAQLQQIPDNVVVLKLSRNRRLIEQVANRLLAVMRADNPDVFTRAYRAETAQILQMQLVRGIPGEAARGDTEHFFDQVQRYLEAWQGGGHAA